jgi:hypothetical protein
MKRPWMMVVLGLAGLAGSLVACSSSGDGASSAPGGTCTSTNGTLVSCAEYSDSEDFQRARTSAAQSSTTTTCVEAGLCEKKDSFIGKCSRLDGLGVFYYSNATTPELKQKDANTAPVYCPSNQGTFSTTF